MHYHIILTERCNLRCKYCYEKSMKEFENGLEKKWNYDENVPFDTEVPIEKLKNFLKSEDTLIFYGGEPLIKIDKIKEIIDNLNCEFAMQTNGILLNKLPINYLNKIKKILISLDGTPERTNHNRGNGKYEIILKNIKEIREKGYKGEIVARMTLSYPDIYEQALHLLNQPKIFNSIHWQIDAGFYKFDFDKEKFTNFAEEYNESVNKLLNYWIKEMERGKVLKIYPFLGIFDTLYYNKKSLIQCGSGHSNFTINTSGKISACPIINSVKNFYCGDISNKKIKNLILNDKECEKCEFFKICGGRCLYWRSAKLWPPEGDKLICETIKNLILKIKEKIPEIKDLIEKKIISEKDFEFERYFGPEIIP